METINKTAITIQATVNAPVEKVWDYYNAPEHVTQWNTPHESWHCPHGTNDLRVGGNFSYRMEAKDGSYGFDFGGVYDTVDQHKLIEYTMGDGRKVSTQFKPQGNATEVITTFDAETQNSIEMQRDGWQAILNNFKNHTESN